MTTAVRILIDSYNQAAELCRGVPETEFDVVEVLRSF